MLNDIAYWCAATYTARQPQTGQKGPTMEEIDRLVDRWPDDDEVGAATFRSEVEATLRAQQARIEELESWKLAVDHRLVSAGCNTAGSYSTPADALDVLIKQEIALANDPLINDPLAGRWWRRR